MTSSLPLKVAMASVDMGYPKLFMSWWRAIGNSHDEARQETPVGPRCRSRRGCLNSRSPNCFHRPDLDAFSPGLTAIGANA
jgi:hypothetical protein